MITRIELTRAEYHDKIYINIPSIKIVIPCEEGCMLLIEDRKYLVKESYDEVKKMLDDSINKRDLLQACFVKAEAERNWFAQIAKTKEGTERAVAIAQAVLCTRFCDWISWGPENENSDKQGGVC